MKIIIAIIALAVLAAGVLFAFSQTAADGTKGGWGRRGGHHRGGGMMLRGLDLTEDQKVQVKQIMEASKSKTQSIRESLKANRQKLNDLTANGAFDEAQIAAVANEQAGLSAQLIVERTRVKSQIFNLLTAEQKAKAAELKGQMKERFKNRLNKRGGEKSQTGTEE